MRNTYKRNRRLATLCLRKEIRQRFFAKVYRPQHGCWLWKASTRRGYGAFWLELGFLEIASRVAYTIAYGMIPAGKIVLHKCDNRLCSRYSHLELGTYQKNTQDGYARGRHKPIQGSHHGMSKLTEEDVIEIRRLHASQQITKPELAKLYSVSRSCIKQVTTNQRWRHV